MTPRPSVGLIHQERAADDLHKARTRRAAGSAPNPPAPTKPPIAAPV
jgi:hypothetical protein